MLHQGEPLKGVMLLGKMINEEMSLSLEDA
jgi:hypothetical protein